MCNNCLILLTIHALLSHLALVAQEQLYRPYLSTHHHQNCSQCSKLSLICWWYLLQ